MCEYDLDKGRYEEKYHELEELLKEANECYKKIFDFDDDFDEEVVNEARDLANRVQGVSDIILIGQELDFQCYTDKLYRKYFIN